MNSKHIACGVVLLLIVCMAQGSLWMHARLNKVRADARAAHQAADATAISVMREQQTLDQLRSGSKALIDYLNLWKPSFDAVDSPQNAELKISMRIKSDNLVSLAQRYEVVAQKNNRSLPYLMRAHTTFEDNYARLLNWLGQMEAELPTMRIGSIRISKGTGPDDLKMDLVMEQPLLKAQ